MRFLFILALAVTGLLGASTGASYAQASRTWVSGVGDDVNPCSRTAPCKTFAGAISKTAAQGQIDGMEEQRQQLAGEQEKLEHALTQLQEKVNHFRSQKEVLKAQYTAASAMSSVNESAAGISTSVSDSGAALERAQDKIATMQARAGALDELMESGVLEDVGGGGDDIQKELDEVTSSSDVEKELAALKAQLGPGDTTPPALPAG